MNDILDRFFEILKKFLSLIFLLFVWFLYLSIFMDTGNIENINCYIQDDFFEKLDIKLKKIIWIQYIKQTIVISVFFLKLYYWTK